MEASPEVVVGPRVVEPEIQIEFNAVMEAVSLSLLEVCCQPWFEKLLHPIHHQCLLMTAHADMIDVRKVHTYIGYTYGLIPCSVYCHLVIVDRLLGHG